MTEIKLRFHVANRDNTVEREIADQDAPHLHSHVELEFPDGASFSSRAFASGKAKKRNGTYYKRIDYSKGGWNTVTIPVTRHQSEVLRAFCDENDGEDYDFEGVAAFKLFLLGQDPDKWFCSEVCTAALQEAGIARDLIPHKTSPDRLYSRLLELFPQ